MSEGRYFIALESVAGHVIRQAQKYDCPCEFTLKDISTVSYKPRNLMIWSRIAKEVMDEYYGQ